MEATTATATKTMTKTDLRFNLVTHPVIRHKLSVLRNKETTALSFRAIIEELAQLLTYEATRDLKTTKQPIETPLEKTEGDFISENFVVVAIMRAGNGMVNGTLRMLPFSTVGHIGIYRDRFIQSTVEYYLRLPTDVKGKRLLLIDPLLATGDTACAAIDRLKEFEVGPIRYLCILSSPEGVARMNQQHPDVEVYTMSLERGLDKKGYIVPGLGDAGDRLYDTV